MNPRQYKSVCMKINTYEKLQYISKNRFDVEVSLASMCKLLIENEYAKVRDPNYVKPLKGDAKYQVWKRKLMNKMGFSTTATGGIDV
jgi:hypothetical protein